jgi:hypothetical protein
VRPTVTRSASSLPSTDWWSELGAPSATSLKAMTSVPSTRRSMPTGRSSSRLPPVRPASPPQPACSARRPALRLLTGAAIRPATRTMNWSAVRRRRNPAHQGLAIRRRRERQAIPARLLPHRLCAPAGLR